MDAHQATLARIEAMLKENPTMETIKLLEKDTRSGVKKLLAKYYRMLEAQQRARERAEALLLEERRLWEQGIEYIGGIDEAGRGPLAGPVAAACVILPKHFVLEGVDDSKKLTPAKRDKLYDAIIAHAVCYSIVLIGPERIDEINIYQATMEAMQQAVASCSIPPQYLLIDAMALKNAPIPQLSLIGGDARSQSIAAASILAKVTRDREMERLSQQYPGYGFDRHKGYCTEDHVRAIHSLGMSPAHRRSFTVPPLSER